MKENEGELTPSTSEGNEVMEGRAGVFHPPPPHPSPHAGVDREQRGTELWPPPCRNKACRSALHLFPHQVSTGAMGAKRTPPTGLREAMRVGALRVGALLLLGKWQQGPGGI